MPIAQALSEIHDRMANAALRAQRTPADVTLIAVSKTFPASAVLEAMAAGQRDFGENRVEEALLKKEEMGGMKLQAIWHLIGHVQSRKAKDVAGQFDWVHSVDSLKLAEILSRRASTHQSPIPPMGHPIGDHILLQCNVSGEASKEGFDLTNWEAEPAKLRAFVAEMEKMLALPALHIGGLMTMAPIVDDPQRARPVFANLRCLREALRERFPELALPHLSMGMSDDFEAAIAEGSTMVRIGRAIFGSR
ncbi:MAG: YggS family pyridoxal phosphate-dependent enzyme [Anaerolineae bacterium]|nr:YggS family pyridoxal phosphate-dependent enzyme [Anaerolineae bacterium]